jgi:dethiobiotin synthetase
MPGYFVTATGTGIGKSFCTAGLIRAGRAAGQAFAGIKPVMSGYEAATAAESDAAALLAAMGRAVTPQNIAAISPWRFTAPLSPDMAAEAEGRRIEFSVLMAFCELALLEAPGVLLIEGVGGVAVPLDERRRVTDWIAGLSLPAILVAGAYLGTLSHTITAAEALLARGIKIEAIVINEAPPGPVPAAQTRDVLARHLPGQHIAIIGQGAGPASFTPLAMRLASKF